MEIIEAKYNIHKCSFDEIIKKISSFNLSSNEIEVAILRAKERSPNFIYIWNEEHIKNNDVRPVYNFIFKSEIFGGERHWFIREKVE